MLDITLRKRNKNDHQMTINNPISLKYNTLKFSLIIYEFGRIFIGCNSLSEIVSIGFL
jgi:hypothetical protein